MSNNPRIITLILQYNGALLYDSIKLLYKSFHVLMEKDKNFRLKTLKNLQQQNNNNGYKYVYRSGNDEDNDSDNSDRRYSLLPNCSSIEVNEFGEIVRNQLLKMSVDGLTGLIKFDLPTGRRSAFSLNIMETTVNSKPFKVSGRGRVNQITCQFRLIKTWGLQYVTLFGSSLVPSC